MKKKRSQHFKNLMNHHPTYVLITYFLVLFPVLHLNHCFVQFPPLNLLPFEYLPHFIQCLRSLHFLLFKFYSYNLHSTKPQSHQVKPVSFLLSHLYIKDEAIPRKDNQEHHHIERIFQITPYLHTYNRHYCQLNLNLMESKFDWPGFVIKIGFGFASFSCIFLLAQVPSLRKFSYL